MASDAHSLRRALQRTSLLASIQDQAGGNSRDHSPNPSKLTKALAPLAKVDSRGQFHYASHFKELLDLHLGDKLVLDGIPNIDDHQAAFNPPPFIEFVKAK